MKEFHFAYLLELVKFPLLICQKWRADVCGCSFQDVSQNHHSVAIVRPCDRQIQQMRLWPEPTSHVIRSEFQPFLHLLKFSLRTLRIKKAPTETCLRIAARLSSFFNLQKY
jgi:hypothetical protein